MRDPMDRALIFGAAVKLQTASTWLAKGCPELDASHKKILHWVGGYLAHVDWMSTANSESPQQDDLFESATVARPVFFSLLSQLIERFERMGITETKQITDFLIALYSLLSSGGGSKVKNALPKEQIEIASYLLQHLSERLSLQMEFDADPDALPSGPQDLEVLLG